MIHHQKTLPSLDYAAAAPNESVLRQFKLLLAGRGDLKFVQLRGWEWPESAAQFFDEHSQRVTLLERTPPGVTLPSPHTDLWVNPRPKRRAVSRPGDFHGAVEIKTAVGGSVFILSLETEMSSFHFAAFETVGQLHSLIEEWSAYEKSYWRNLALANVMTYPSVGFLRRCDLRTWDSLFLDPELEHTLKAEAPRFLQARAFFEQRRIPYRRGILLYGPPGNGKTRICEAVAASTDQPFLIFKAGEPGEAVCIEELEKTLAKAQEIAPALVCFEDLDLLFNGRENAGMSQFLNMLDGMHSAQGLMVLATTNHPERIDRALISRPGRFDVCYRIANPECAVRRKFLGEKFPGFAPESVERLVALSKGLSFAQLVEVFVGSHLNCYDSGDAPDFGHVEKQIHAQHKHKSDIQCEFKESAKIGFQAK